MTLLITTSWDDGHPSDLRLAELLERYQIKATFYVPQRSQRELLDTHDLQQLAKRFELGAHGLDHLPLTAQSDEQAERQISGSRDWIEQLTGTRCTVFCPPLGKFCRRHRTMIAKAGFLGFRTVELGASRTVELGASTKGAAVNQLIELPTTLQAYPHSRRTLVANALRRGRLRRALTAAIQPPPTTWSELAAASFNRDMQSSPVHFYHLWGHSWELDECDLWDSLEQVLQRCQVAVQQGRARCVTNGELVRHLGGNG